MAIKSNIELWWSLTVLLCSFVYCQLIVLVDDPIIFKFLPIGVDLLDHHKGFVNGSTLRLLADLFCCPGSLQLCLLLGNVNHDFQNVEASVAMELRLLLGLRRSWLPCMSRSSSSAIFGI